MGCFVLHVQPFDQLVPLLPYSALDRGADKAPPRGQPTEEGGSLMRRFLMCSHGAAQVTDAPPPGCTFVGTVAADGERYRVLRGEDKTLYAAPAEWVE